MSPRPGILFVDDELENVEIAAEILEETSDRPVRVATSVEEAVSLLHSEDWALVVMDVFIPLGDHPQKVLGPRARKVQEHIEHLGGLVLLEEIERLDPMPMVLTHTACTDHVLLELLGDRVSAKIPKPAPLDTLLHHLMDALSTLDSSET